MLRACSHGGKSDVAQRGNLSLESNPNGAVGPAHPSAVQGCPEEAAREVVGCSEDAVHTQGSGAQDEHGRAR